VRSALVRALANDDPAAKPRDLRHRGGRCLDGIDVDSDNRQNTGILLDYRPEHIVLRNFVIKNTHHPTEDGGTGIWVRGAEDAKGVQDLTIENFEIYNVCVGCCDTCQAGSGIHIWGNNANPSRDIVIRNCAIHDIGTEDAIHMGVFGYLVENVTVENCSFWHNKENAIDIKHAYNITMRNLEIWDHWPTATDAGAGIVVHQGAKDILVDSCIFHENTHGFNAHWNGAAATWDSDVERVTVKNSIFYNNEKFAIFIGDKEEHVRDVKIYNNVIYNNPSRGIYLYDYVDGIEIKNNVFAGNGVYDIAYNKLSLVHSLVSDFNDFAEGGKIYAGRTLDLSSFRQQYPQEQNSIAAEPQFSDAPGLDFTLQSTSPLIDAGTYVGTPYGGSAPDIGAFEYSASEDYFMPEEEIEAEDGELTPPMQAFSDTPTTQYISSLSSGQGSASYAFKIDKTGEYVLRARVMTPEPAAGRDSFYVGLDNVAIDDAYSYDVIHSGYFVWDTVSLRGTGNLSEPEFNPKVWSLAPGIYSFTFHAREMDTRIDKVMLSAAMCAHASDTDCDGCINLAELISYMNLWKAGSASLLDVMDTINVWKSGC